MINTPDGRVLCLEEAGDPAGSAVLVQNGAPSSRHLYPPHAASALEHGIRLIAYDRPGYGRSTPQPGRSMVDCVNDVRTIAEALSIRRLAVWGFSMGGPHALACAAALPDIVSAVAVLASYAPFGSPGLDYGSKAARQEFEDEATAIRTDPEKVHATFKAPTEQALAWTPETLLESWRAALSPSEVATLTPDFADYRVRAYHSGLGPGDEGWWEDEVAYFQPWGFAIESIDVPVILCQGDQDDRVPLGHFRWLAEHIPDVEDRLQPGAGHLSLFLRGFDLTRPFLLDHLEAAPRLP